MTLTELQPYIALVLGSIGTILGIVNLYRDISKNKENVEITACPVVRLPITDSQKSLIGMEVSKLEMETTQNPYRNIGIWSVENLTANIEQGTIPNLIGFEITNLSNKSVFIDSIGLANKENKSKYRGSGFDAIQSLKAETTETNGIEVKQNAKFTTYLFIDELAAKQLIDGSHYPFIETASKKKRVYNSSPVLEYFSSWLSKQQLQNV